MSDKPNHGMKNAVADALEGVARQVREGRYGHLSNEDDGDAFCADLEEALRREVFMVSIEYMGD